MTVDGSASDTLIFTLRSKVGRYPRFSITWERDRIPGSDYRHAEQCSFHRTQCLH